MTKQVPRLSERHIERDAAALLAEYALGRGVTIEAPIPIEDIVEKHLKLPIDFDDLDGRVGIPRFGLRSNFPDCKPDILGAIYFDERRILIDEFLDPEEHPSREGFYRFTLAHEGAVIGACTAPCSPRTRRRVPSSTSDRPRWSAVRARQGNASSGRQIFMPPVC